MPANSLHPDYKKFLPKWERCRDVCAGQDDVQAAGTKYLPKLNDQAPNDYKAYVQRATFYNATWRTIAGLVGMLFRKPPEIDAPELLKGVSADVTAGRVAKSGLFDDVDGAGQPLQLFQQEVSEEALKFGRIGILCDYPVAPEGITAADAEAMNLRPVLCQYDTFAIINWKKGRVNNKTVLTQAVLREQVWIPKDEFEGEMEDRWRVLDLAQLPANPGDKTPSEPVYRQRLFKLDKSKSRGGGGRSQAAVVQDGPDIFPKMNGKEMAFIPFRIISGAGGEPFEVEDPPLIDLVDMNLSHYRTKADHEHGCHFTALPTLVLTGWTKDNPGDKIYLGSEAALVTKNPDAKATFAEFTGQGLQALENNLERKEAQMAVLGARMLEPQKKGVETAEAEGQHRKGEESMLASVAQAISLGMTQVLKWFAEWAGEDPSKVKAELNRDFYPVKMTPQMLSALISGWQQGVPGLSDQGLFAKLKAGEIVAEDVSLEDEQARLEARSAELAAQAEKLGVGVGGAPGAGPPPKEELPPGMSKGKGGEEKGAIHIHIPKGSGKRTVTGPKGQKYVIEED